MYIISAEQDKLTMMLHQLGAKVQTIHGILSFVKFEIDNTEISYVYNVNLKDQFFLQRIKPYPLGAGIFPTQKDIFQFIKEDIEQFKNASHSRVFEKFVDVNNKLHGIIHNLEDLFFEYNVPGEDMHTIDEMLASVEEKIAEIKKKSPKIELK